MYKKVVKFSFIQQEIFWVLVFNFMYLVSVDPMDRSEDYITLTFSAKIVWCTLANPTHVSSMVRTLLSVLNIALKLEEQKILSLVTVSYCLNSNQGLYINV